MDSFDDIIFAPATSVGSGAISIIRISGPHCLNLVDRIVGFKHGNASCAAGYTVKFGTIAGLDDVLVSIFRSPNSYTGEDSAEISCHASPFIVGRIMEMLSVNGGRVAEPGEFTRRAFLGGKMDLAQAEAVADVIASSSAEAHRVALNQLRGGYSAIMHELRNRLLRLTALLELELDFSEEEVEFADRRELNSLLDECISRVGTLAASFRDGNALRNGVPVVIVGAPNSGKSTLLNALLHEERAIVSDIEGTTRDTVEETMTLGGIVFRFIDTAGIRRSSDHIESLGIERSFAAISKADIVLVVVDSSRTCTADHEALGKVLEMAKEWQKVFVLENKTDIANDSSDGRQCSGSVQSGCPVADGAAGETESGIADDVNAGAAGGIHADAPTVRLRISAKKGTGLDTLRNLLVASQLNRFSDSDTLVTNARHHAVLLEALSALNAARTGLADGLPTVLISEHLREALSSLGAITGEISTDEVLGEIFAKFCIGK